MKVLMENFTENIRDQIPETDPLEHFHYREEQQEKEEEALRNAVIKQQQGLKEFHRISNSLLWFRCTWWRDFTNG